MFMEASYSRLIWDALEHVYGNLGFDAVNDDVFRDLVLARIIEPVSKLDTIRVIEELVFAALAIARRIEYATGISIKKFVQKMRLLRTGKVSISGKICEVPPDIPIEAADILRKLDL